MNANRNRLMKQGLDASAFSAPTEQPAATATTAPTTDHWWKDSPDELSKQGIETCDERDHPGRGTPEGDCWWCNFSTRGWERGWCPQDSGGGGGQQSPSSGGGGGGGGYTAPATPAASPPPTIPKETAAVAPPGYGTSAFDWGAVGGGGSRGSIFGGASQDPQQKKRMQGVSTQSGSYVPGIGGM